MSETFRPKSNFVWAGTSITLLILFAINSLVVLSSTKQIISEMLVAIGLSALAYLIWIKPKLVFHEEMIVIVNPFTTEAIRYDEILDLETKWALQVVHTRGKTRVWVAPASGKRKWIADKRFGWYGSNMPLSQQSSLNNSESMSASLDSSSGQAAYMIKERIRRRH